VKTYPLESVYLHKVTETSLRK